MVKTQHGGDSSTQAKKVPLLIWKPMKAKTNSTTSSQKQISSSTITSPRTHNDSASPTRTSTSFHRPLFSLPSRISAPRAVGKPASERLHPAGINRSDRNRGIPGEEPAACGGELGDFVAAALSAPAILAITLASQTTGTGAHIDVSQYESMMLAFQTYRPIFDHFAPDFRPTRQIEIPSVEPAKDGWVGFCTITGQQWQDFAPRSEQKTGSAMMTSPTSTPEWSDETKSGHAYGHSPKNEPYKNSLTSHQHSGSLSDPSEPATKSRHLIISPNATSS